MKIDLTVLICTHNSAKRISDTLEHLKKQKGANSIKWEVLIVDYISTDGTPEKAKNILANTQIPFTIINETQPGKTPALETGFKNARGEAICIIDDDNWADENYIFVANQVMSSHSDVGVIGAYGKAYCEIAPPEWFEDRKATYAVGAQGSKSGYVEDGKRFYFWGAGSVIRKSAWIKAKEKGFVPRLNPSRGKEAVKFKKGFTGGEDPELCYAIQYVGYRLWYEPNLIYTHYIPSQRLTLEFILNTAAGVNAAAPLSRLYECQLYPKTFSGGLRRSVYRSWWLHMLYIVRGYFAALWRNRGSMEMDRIGRAVAHHGYQSEMRGLWQMSAEFRNIRESITALAR